mmetsp:Transcript_44524/g.117867  ORF Transcript_44524/g.117867 Transcript_44524/m.117867 type:complete len:210 (-) Transcript_44524:774-1403(-)
MVFVGFRDDLDRFVGRLNGLSERGRQRRHSPLRQTYAFDSDCPRVALDEVDEVAESPLHRREFDRLRMVDARHGCREEPLHDPSHQPYSRVRLVLVGCSRRRRRMGESAQVDRRRLWPSIFYLIALVPRSVHAWRDAHPSALPSRALYGSISARCWAGNCNVLCQQHHLDNGFSLDSKPLQQYTAPSAQEVLDAEQDLAWGLIAYHALC